MQTGAHRKIQVLILEAFFFLKKLDYFKCRFLIKFRHEISILTFAKRHEYGNAFVFCFVIRFASVLFAILVMCIVIDIIY